MAAEDGRLHHFALGFEDFQNCEEKAVSEKVRLTRYYEQLRQSIVENGNYADALLETAEAGYMVNLTEDRMEQVFYQKGILEFLVSWSFRAPIMNTAKKNATKLPMKHWRITVLWILRRNFLNVLRQAQSRL